MVLSKKRFISGFHRHFKETPQLGSVPSLSSVLGPPGGDRPQCYIRFATNGDILRDTGDTGSPASYVKVGEWLSSVPPLDSSDWEVHWDVQSETGDPGTWTGSLGGFAVLNFQRDFTWSKDSNSEGDADSTVTVRLRQVSDNTNSTTAGGKTYSAEITL